MSARVLATIAMIYTILLKLAGHDIWQIAIEIFIRIHPLKSVLLSQNDVVKANYSRS